MVDGYIFHIFNGFSTNIAAIATRVYEVLAIPAVALVVDFPLGLEKPLLAGGAAKLSV